MVNLSRDGSFVIRSIFAFIVAVLVAYLIGAALATQHVLGALTDMGMDITFAVWAEATLHDLIGMFAIYVPLITVAFLIGIPVALLISRGRPGWRRIGYIVGCFTSIVAIHSLMPQVLDVTPVAATRYFSGLMMQGFAGAVAGYVFYLLGRARLVEASARTASSGDISG
jgi:hypothetical protein